jgi:hypothetical protein
MDRLSSCLFVLVFVSADSPLGAPAIPFPDALESATITVDRLDDIRDHALILGNGDINALLYSDAAGPCLMLTKNDVWDARLITANDPPLPKLAWIKKHAPAMKPGGNTEIHEDGFRSSRRDGYHDHPYPFPKPCARLAFGRGIPGAHWTVARAQGTENSFRREGDVAVMRIAGDPGCSNGYAIPVGGDKLKEAKRLRITLSGTRNVRFFIDILNRKGAAGRFALHTGWIDTPAQEADHFFDLTEPEAMERLILYTWSTDGKKAANRIRTIAFFDGQGRVIAQLPLDEAALATRRFRGTLNLRRAVAHVSEPPASRPLLTARALADRNVFLLECELPCTIVPTATFDCAPPRQGTTHGIAWLTQELPGDGDWPGMTYAVALAGAARAKAAAIVTSFEATDPQAAAVQLAMNALAANRAQLVHVHEATWAQFWSASGVDLADPFLRDVWYRNLYFLRCVSKPGVECVGLYAGSVTEGCPAWHGNHTLNYNAQQTFWSAFVTNHVELVEPYVRLIDRYLPRARWLCRQLFDFAGAYIPHVVVAHEPVDPTRCTSRNGRQYIHHVWGFTMGVSAFAVQNVWLRYAYAPDRTFLASTAYPLVQDVAVFQANYMDTCATDPADPTKVILAPSVSPEHWGWTRNFERNRNSTFDIAMFHFVFAAAIEGAQTLGRDAHLVPRWRACRDRLPAYPTHGKDEPVIVDMRGAPPITYNIAVPAVPVFPGDQVTWFSPERERTVFARTIDRLRWNGNNSAVIMSVARARLSMPDSLAFMRTTFQDRQKPNGTLGLNRIGAGINRHGHYTEQFAAAMAVSELLLQSAGGAVRVFPAWPAEKDARFVRLRTQGGFLISAEQEKGEVKQIAVTSTAGGTFRLVSPWKAMTRVRGDSAETLIPGTDNLVELDTRAGERLLLRPR